MADLETETTQEPEAGSEPRTLHDRIFKEFLERFLPEFMRIFFPEEAA